jgi:tetratricopeptide (TPR) repeat protein
LAERNPQSEQLQRDFSVACYKLALMYEQLEDAAGAEKYFIKDMEIAEKLWRDNPRNVGLGEDLLVTYQGFAKRMAQQGDRATCITYLERAIQVCQDLFACAARETYQSQLQALQEELVQVQGLK